MRLFALTVGRNEQDRYLESMLRHTAWIVDGHFFYDDQSTDETAAIAERAGCRVKVRPEGEVSFAQNEGVFRGAAWAAFEETVQPQDGDWVIVIDCDEFIVSYGDHATDSRLVRSALESLTDFVSDIAVNIDIPEVFGFDHDGRPLIRVDRLWGTIHAPRLFRYRPGGAFATGVVGVPAVPNYVMGGSWYSTDALQIMHYGYANPHDRAVKYDRYSGQGGHSNAHVESILSDSELVRWEDDYVKVGPWTPSTL